MTKTQIIQSLNNVGFKENVIQLTDKVYNEHVEKLSYSKYGKEFERCCKGVKNLSVRFVKSLFDTFIWEYRCDNDLCVLCGADLKEYPGDAYWCGGCSKTITESDIKSMDKYKTKLPAVEEEDDLPF